MKVLKSFLDFKTEIVEMCGHNIVFATDSNGVIWHEYANENNIKSNFVVVENNTIISHGVDPTTMSPIDNVDIYEVDEFTLSVGDTIVIDGDFILAYTPTQEELESELRKKEIEFYNKELEFASKATAELACEIITDEMFEDVKIYMKAIDPYASKKKRKVRIGRPPIFDRYN